MTVDTSKASVGLEEDVSPEAKAAGIAQGPVSCCECGCRSALRGDYGGYEAGRHKSRMHPGQSWVAPITYLPTQAFPWCIVGWAITVTISAATINRCLTTRPSWLSLR